MPEFTDRQRKSFTTLKFKSGKHADKSYLEVAQNDPDYILWMKNKMGDDVKHPGLKELFSLF